MSKGQLSSNSDQLVDKTDNRRTRNAVQPICTMTNLPGLYACKHNLSKMLWYFH